MSDYPDLLTVAEVAKILRLNPVTVRRLLSTGQLVGMKIGGSWRIPRSELELQEAPSHDEANQGDTSGC